MKLSINLSNNPRRGFYAALFLLICLCAGGCQDDFEMKLPLNVNSNELELAEGGGTTQVMVYSTGKWSVEFEQPIEWGSLDRLEGEGNGHFVFSYSQNFGAPRKVNILLKRGNQSQVVSFLQAGLTPSMKFKEAQVSLVKNHQKVKLPFSTNLKVNIPDFVIDVTYDDELSEEWVSDIVVSDSAVYFMALPNNLGENRKARLSLSYVDGKEESYATFIDLLQTTETPVLAFETETYEVNKLGGRLIIPFTTNLQASLSNMTVELTATWCEEPVLASQGIQFFVTPNETGQPRSITINLVYKDEAGTTFTFPVKVEQSATAYQALSFDMLRNLIPGVTGTLVIDQPFTLIGTVISDKNNPNLETNPNLTFSSIDFNENARTAYIQATDGSYGIRIKTTTPDENIFMRYATVDLSLQGLTLVKEANPERYTLTDVTAATVLKTMPGTASALAQKNKKIGELTDADLYTFVSLAETEFALSDGAYTNVNDGYQILTDWSPKGTTAPRVDCAMINVRDKGGDELNMLLNSNVSWRRKGNGVPKGSGTLNGILVHTKLLRYGFGEGEIGRYAIRPLEEEDIAIDKNETSRFSNTLVEWNWNKGVLNGDATTGVTPDIYNAENKSATITHSEGLAGALTSDYNDVRNDGSGKGVVSNQAFQYVSRWWNAEKNTGEAFVVQFSTAGVNSQNLNVCFSIGSGNGGAAACNAPTYWQLEYSTNGTDYNVLNNSDFCVRPVVWWSNTALFCSPGNRDYSFRLPDGLFNQPKVYLKLKAKRNICSTATSSEGGVITATTPTVNVRLGALSIKYNK